MTHAVLAALIALALVWSAPSQAADPKSNFLDHSNDALMDDATAFAIMKEAIPAKVWKLYQPASTSF